MDAVELGFKVVGVLFDISPFNVDSHIVTGESRGIYKVFSLKVCRECLCCHGDSELVADKVHQHSCRDGFFIVVFSIDEVFDNFISVT